MPKKEDSSNDESLNRGQEKYFLEDVLRKSFNIQNIEKDGEKVEKIIKKMCNVDDYMKSIFCVGMAIEMLKENGLKIDVIDTQNEEFYFVKKDNKIVMDFGKDDDKAYLALLEQFLYKWLDIIDISDFEKKELSSVLDQVQDNANVFYEELTQKEIKMLEWIDEKLVDVVNKINVEQEIYKTNVEFLDTNVSDLVSVYLMWGRSLERLEIVSQILNPLLEYTENNILSKFENYIISKDSKDFLDKIETPDYFRIKLSVMSTLSKLDISQDEKSEILREIRTLEVPKQTNKTLQKISKLLGEKLNDLEKLKEMYDRFIREREIYNYSIKQRNDELGSIDQKKSILNGDKKNNLEIITQLINLEDVIKEEKKDLEKSLSIIEKKLNFIKKAGVDMSENNHELDYKETADELKDYAKELLNIKLSNNRYDNLSCSTLDKVDYDDNKGESINFEYEKFLEKMKDRNFDLSDDFFYKSMNKEKDKDLSKVKVFEPNLNKTTDINKNNKNVDNIKEL